ncbi:hypothetical protein H257_03774 [Aphanomyces astaci]|uniref:Acyltransferase n=1 Tax=Aphanomyces astaci TaxID=112090 RepID=W4GZ79_APHAT|nr:hypothetical protein H257_03774 [Aphanomyces astaci]ETV84621.1 hypothetical protein H257_03774 [Aphanomyces astaci]|eukprot:XP_009826313.1 hypothetical protein H257_03774 [Aphanomyces astaci]
MGHFSTIKNMPPAILYFDWLSRDGFLRLIGLADIESRDRGDDSHKYSNLVSNMREVKKSGSAVSKPAAAAASKDDGVVRLHHPDPSFCDTLPSFLFNALELAISIIAIHYLVWPVFTGVFLYYIHTLGYTYVSVALILAYVPTFLNNAHMKLTPKEGGMQWDWLRQHSAWKFMCSYTKLEIVREAELDPTKQYVFAYHPHGILILSRISTYAGNFEALFPGIVARALGATPMFYIPMAREICLWLAAVDASRKNAERILKDKMSVIVYPGGSKEIFLTDPKSKQTTLVLNKRLGFIRLAVRYGADIVPTFVFGEKWMYNIWNPPKSVRHFFLSTLKVPLLLFWGRGFTWLPKRLTGKRKFGVVHGKPIPVVQNENPTEEELVKIHTLYVEELNDLFLRYKAQFGYDDDETLVIQ